MKNFLPLLFMMMICSNAMNQTPVIKLTTSKLPGSQINFYCRATAPNTNISVDFGNSTLESFSIGIDYTEIKGTIVGTQSISIYGDNLNSFGCSDNQLTMLDVSGYPALSSLSCTYNLLTSLDLSKNVALKELHCLGNQLTSLDLNKNVNLNTVYCDRNQLKSLNLILDTALVQLSCSSNKLKSINVSRNKKLESFSCFENQLTALDVRNNTELKYFLCSNNELSELDLSLNTKLNRFDCSHNKLSTLDVSKNVSLEHIFCWNNNLTHLDVTQNKALQYLEIMNNKFTFATIPRNNQFSFFEYAPQEPIVIDKDHNTAAVIDLSSQFLINENKTTFTWKTTLGSVLSEGTDYINTAGKIVFLRPLADSVYCEMTNVTYPDLSGDRILKTTKSKIKGKSINVAILTTAQPIGSVFSFFLKAKTAHTPIKVDFGDGNLICKTVGTSKTLISGTLTGSQVVKFFGRGITYLDCSNNQLTDLDIPAENALTELYCINNLLTFATLPLQQPTWKRYVYSPQKAIPVSDALDPEIGLDLGKQYKIRKNKTVFVWKNKRGIPLIEGVDYNIINGRTKFLKSRTDSIRCEMTNLTFPALTCSNKLRTTYTKVVNPPVIIMTSNLTPGSPISVVLKAKTCNTPIKVNFGDETLVKYTLDTSKNIIRGIFVGSQTLRLYGDGIIYFSPLDGAVPYSLIVSIDVSRDTELQYLSVKNNIITSLDVSHNKALRYLYCTKSNLQSLDVSKNTELRILYCDTIGLTALDVSKNTALQYLSCARNQIAVLDASKNTALKSLICHSNQLLALDLRKNTKLKELNCDWNSIATLNLPPDNALTKLTCRSNKLTSLDVSASTRLIYLDCIENYLTNLNVKNNKELRYLNCSINELSSLDISKNLKLDTLECFSNRLKFSTLPLKSTTMTEYNYHPQKLINIPKSLVTGDEIDLSSENMINGNATVFEWKSKIFRGYRILVAGIDYNITGGKTVFLKSQPDSIYCEMMNITFPDFTRNQGLLTTKTMVSSNPVKNDFKSKDKELIDVNKELIDVKIYSCLKTVYIDIPCNAQTSIFDMNGRMIISKSINAGINNLQLKTPGIYVVRINYNKGSIARKIIIE